MIGDGWIHLHQAPTLPLDLLGHDLVDEDLLATSGPHLSACTKLLTEVLGGAPVLLTPSCTDALELAALLVGVGPGDEVILPTFTFPSTANAFLLRGATVRFADVRSDTLNIDPDHVASLRTDQTRVVVAVHYAGVGCDMEALAAAGGPGSVVVEDAAHGLFGTWQGKPLGTIGAVGALSFHRTKNLAVGEGGALVVNDPLLLARAEVLVSKGTDRLAFERGDVSTYTWQDLGTAGLMTELTAALLEYQLRHADPVQRRRHEVFARYQAALADWAGERGVRLPSVPDDVSHAAHLYWMVLPSRSDRDALGDRLAAERIEAVHHYLPLHTSPMGQRSGGRVGQCPVAEAAGAGLLRLPLHAALTDADVDRVIAAVLSS